MNTLKRLENNELYSKASSIFTQVPAATTTDKYSFVSTLDVLNTLEAQGWVPTQANQTRCRIADKRAFTKHAIRLTQLSNLSQPDGFTEVPQLLLTNSHDGSSSYTLRIALHVYLCSNGIVASSGNLGIERLRHVGLTAEQVLQATARIEGKTRLLTETIGVMKNTQLQYSEAYTFALRAAEIRYGSANINRPKGFTEVSLLTPRRPEERGFDLWSVFNRVQENLTQSGLRGVRSLKAIDRNIKVNEQLWSLAETFLNR